jgi:hypothetical protein
MVLFVGYTNFVSAFDFDYYLDQERLADEDAKTSIRRSDVPPWLNRLDYSGL